ncbi:MAG TPA: hypothetical protein VFR86_26260 [Burkholderiaceae bacterium]|nr:hypothetical protein [Burkholderiaceae bacterium]
MSAETDRVRCRTAGTVLRRIDDATYANLLEGAEAQEGTIEQRLHELDREWDVDRAIETEAAAAGLVGLALGTLVRPALLAVPAFVAGAVLVYALTGRYPWLPVFRRLGLRTAREIARERYALKALRGDFEALAEVDRDSDVGRRETATTPALLQPAPEPVPEPPPALGGTQYSDRGAS